METIAGRILLLLSPNVIWRLPIDSQEILKNSVFGFVVTMILKNISKVQRTGQRTTEFTLCTSSSHGGGLPVLRLGLGLVSV
jgi:hypothetical protein